MNSLDYNLPREKTLLVDRDGTLVGTCRANFKAYSAALKGLSIGLPKEFEDSFHRGLSWTDIATLLLPHIPSEILDKIHIHKKMIFEDYFGFLSWNHHLIDSLNHAKWALVSNGAASSSKQMLNMVKSLKPFAIIGPGLSLLPKPAPDMYLYAISKFNLKNEDVLVVEDSITGFDAAKGAGLTVHLVKHIC